MKFLFIVQGEGRGHLTQAIALAGMLQRNGHQVAEVLVGCSEFRQVPLWFEPQIAAPVCFYPSPNFIRTADHKHFRIYRSIIYNLQRKRRKAYFMGIRFISNRIVAIAPDVVVNFYELLGGLAYRRYGIKVPMVCIAHQFIFEHPAYQFSHCLSFTQQMLRLYTKLSCMKACKRLALSFVEMKDSGNIFVVPPLLRHEIISLVSGRQSYILGYILNHGFAAEIAEWQQHYPETEVHVFWDKPDMPLRYMWQPNLFFHQLDDRLFLQMMAGCSAFFGTAGFESVSEALYLGKPILIVPAHAEQEMNAADALRTGSVVVAASFNLDKLSENAQTVQSNTTFREWVNSAEKKILACLTSIQAG